MKKAKKFTETTNHDVEVKIQSFKELWDFITSNQLFILILLSLTFLLYFNSLTGKFISGDDVNGYLNNPQVSNLTTGFSSFYLQHMFWSLLYATFGKETIPLHILSVVFHAINVTLVFILAYMLFGRRISIVTALLFASHPVNTEAVSWISGFPYLYLATLGYLIFIFHNMYFDTRKALYFYVAVFIYSVTIILVRNPWVLVFPFCLLILDILLFKMKGRDLKTEASSKQLPQVFAALKKTMIYFIPSIVFITWYVVSNQSVIVSRVSSLNTAESTPLLFRIPYTIFMMLKLYLVPYDLTLLHEGEIITQPLYILMIACTILFFVLILILVKLDLPSALLLGLLVVSILPTLSPKVVVWFIAERYLYFGGLFFALFVARYIVVIHDIFKTKYFVYLACGILLLTYGIRTILRNNDWQDSKTLWQATAKVSVNSPRVYNNLGDVYFQEGNHLLALSYFQQAVGLSPDYADAYHNVGNTYMYMGNYDAAVSNFLKSLEFNPNLYQSYYKLGLIDYKKGNFPSTREYMNKVLQIDPANTEAKQVLSQLK